MKSGHGEKGEPQRMEEAVTWIGKGGQARWGRREIRDRIREEDKTALGSGKG